MGVGGPFGVGRLGGWDWKDLEWIVKSGIQMERLFDGLMLGMASFCLSVLAPPGRICRTGFVVLSWVEGVDGGCGDVHTFFI